MSWLLERFSFEGAVGRGRWWGDQAIAAMVILASLSGFAFDPPYPITLLIVPVALLLSVAADIKRCRDRGKSGWWVLLALVPYVGALWMVIELGMMPGKQAELSVSHSAPA